MLGSSGNKEPARSSCNIGPNEFRSALTRLSHSFRRVVPWGFTHVLSNADMMFSEAATVGMQYQIRCGLCFSLRPLKRGVVSIGYSLKSTSLNEQASHVFHGPRLAFGTRFLSSAF